MMQEATEVSFTLVAAGATDIGGSRTHNEDAVLLRPDLHLFLLADGAGGHEAGNVASALATTSVVHFFEATEKAAATKPDIDDFGLATGARRLAAAIQKANRDIVEISKSSNKHRGMGSTLVAASAAPRGSMLHVGHVGDSRCYRLRGGHLEQLTHDHSLINDVLEMRPDLDDKVVAKLPRHVVTRALGMDEALRVSVRTFELMANDRYLLCSDGLTDVLGPDDIIEALTLSHSPEPAVHLLIEMAKDAGSRDNIAAVVIACEPLPSGPVLGLKKSNRPPRKRSVPPPPEELMGTHDDSSPEIVIVSEGEEPTVVPARSANAGLLDALEGFAPRKPR